MCRWCMCVFVIILLTEYITCCYNSVIDTSLWHQVNNMVCGVGFNATITWKWAKQQCKLQGFNYKSDTEENKNRQTNNNNCAIYIITYTLLAASFIYTLMNMKNKFKKMENRMWICSGRDKSKETKQKRWIK